jgi:hypothetical protein
LNIFVYSLRLNAFHLIVLESLSCDTPSLLTTYYEVFEYAEMRAVIRIRSLDIKGLVNETYELPRSGD